MSLVGIYGMEKDGTTKISRETKVIRPTVQTVLIPIFNAYFHTKNDL